MAVARADAAPPPAPVALVTQLKGAARVDQAGDRGPLELLHELLAGATVTLEARTTVVLVHTAGKRIYELQGPGRFAVLGAGVAGLANARATERELPAAFRDYQLKAVVSTQASLTMRDSRTVKLEGPRGGVLRAGELVYRIGGELRKAQVAVVDGRGRVVTQFEPVGGMIDLSAAAFLGTFEEYTLSVSGVDALGRPVSLSARFALLPPADAAALEKHLQQSPPSSTELALVALAMEAMGAAGSAAAVWERVMALR